MMPILANLVSYIVAAATEVTSNTATCTLMMPILANLVSYIVAAAKEVTGYTATCTLMMPILAKLVSGTCKYLHMYIRHAHVTIMSNIRS